MRTTKRFTPSVLERFRKQQRGEGIFVDYSAWHQVTRGDPTSRGRSHIMTLRGRPHDFLSDLERNVALFSWMNLRLIDLREQFPLSLESSVHELAAYGLASRWRLFPGTLQLAKGSRIRHPTVSEKGVKAPWVMTTDLLLTLRSSDGRLWLVALSCKYESDLDSVRKRQLLTLEREYWLSRGVRWCLITESLMHPFVVDNLVRTWHWGLVSSPTAEELHHATRIGRALEGRTVHGVLCALADKFGCMTRAQDAFWRAVWTGRLPMRLINGWRPTECVRLMAPRDFWLQNPVITGRDAWNS